MKVVLSWAYWLLFTVLQAIYCMRPSARLFSSPRWLVVGDGDLSFSAQQAPRLSSHHLIATVLEDQETHHSVYRNSVNQTTLIRQAGHEVHFGIDATQLSQHFSSPVDRIQFNFPHWRGKANNRRNRQLISDFLASASQQIDDTGEIHVALLHGQGGSEARSIGESRQSWMAAEYAAEHGLLLKRMEVFEANYRRSSHRGADRGFAVGDEPLLYVFGKPNRTSIDPRLQMACRHELRIHLDPQYIENSPWSEAELVSGKVVAELAAKLVPDGVLVEVPMSDITSAASSPWSWLILLLVYRGDSQPLTRALADDIRAQLEQAVADFGLAVVKRNRLVSKPFPYALLPTLVEEYTRE